jgi:hypothetical protein
MHRFAEEPPVTDRELRREFEWQRRQTLKQFVGKVVRKIMFRLTREENVSTDMAALEEALRPTTLNFLFRKNVQTL